MPFRSSHSGMFSKNNCPQMQPSKCTFQYRSSELEVKLFGQYLWRSAAFSKFACSAFLLLTIFAEELYFITSFC